MKKVQKKSLNLSRETISRLNDSDLKEIAGARPNPTRTMCMKDTCFYDSVFVCP